MAQISSAFEDEDDEQSDCIVFKQLHQYQM